MTPPEMMNAITAAASASMRCTRSAGTTRMCPANPYDCGMYTDTCPDTPNGASDSDVRNANTLSEPSAESDTSTGLSNRRFSPTNAFSMSLADEYSSRTNGSFSKHLVERAEHASRDEPGGEESDDRDQHDRDEEADAWDRQAEPTVDRPEDQSADVDGDRERGDDDQAPEEVFEEARHADANIHAPENRTRLAGVGRLETEKHRAAGRRERSVREVQRLGESRQPEARSDADSATLARDQVAGDAEGELANRE